MDHAAVSFTIAGGDLDMNLYALSASEFPLVRVN